MFQTVIRLIKCGHGDFDGEDRENCCLVGDGNEQKYFRCPVFDWEPCPFNRRVEGCGTCAHATAMTFDDEGPRMVDCELNDRQMYAPYATTCKHWEKALDES